MKNTKIDYERNFLHHSQLFWNVTLIFTTALGGLLIFLTSKNGMIIFIQEVILNGFGLFLTGVLIYFACSFRVLKQEAFAKAMNNNQMEQNKTHLGQWIPYLLVWWTLGILFLLNLFLIASWLLILTLLQVLWTSYVTFMGTKYYKTDSLKDAEQRFELKMSTQNNNQN